MEFYLQKEIQSVRVVDSNRKYWLIRTYSGHLFNKFYREGYVGIGFNEIPLEYIKEASKKDIPTFNRLKTFIEENSGYKLGVATNWTNQLINFYHHIGTDDIIVMPSASSDVYAIGVIKSKKTKVKKEKGTFLFDGKNEPFPEKTKDVEWLKVVPRKDFLGDVAPLLSSHQAVYEITKYSDIIEGNISSIYVKDELAHLVLKVDQDEDINAYAFRDFLDGMTYFYELFGKQHGDYSEEKDLTIKIKVQSKGKVALAGVSIAGLLGIAGLVAMSNNTELKMELGPYGKIEAKTDGFLNSLSDYKDKELEREIKRRRSLIEDSLRALKVKTVNDTSGNPSIEINESSLKQQMIKESQRTAILKEEISGETDRSLKENLMKEPRSYGKENDGDNGRKNH